MLLHHFERDFSAGAAALGLGDAAIATLANDGLELVLFEYAITHCFVHAVLVSVLELDGLARLAVAAVAGARPARRQLVQRLLLHLHLLRRRVSHALVLRLVERVLVFVHLRPGLRVLVDRVLVVQLARPVLPA